MLEIKYVEKTYCPKKGVPVKALDGVSLSFADTGLVFILGKSGSGKSTLLNVIGGLDKADSGEFIIKGKSSKSFKQSDFDAYRNTFIGFIFQEYNILNEFNVGQNIALAMELQGKKATSEALEQILDQVDLPGFATRKPNELSGGQKQRVAIARALIKEPEIIMADEPTGALDSNTGKQVFDTLKKLSKTKLVIVVSHDRDFAEYYGDRVIELADGRIISDITKYESEGEKKSEQVSIIDNSIVHIKKGKTLTDADFEIIRKYIKSHDGDILISSDERANSSFKQMAMLSDDGSKASFKETTEKDVPKKEYTPDESKFIHSRLPFRNAFKIGASSLKTKPVRLVFTILLSFIAFALFGLTDTLASYNRNNAAYTSTIDSNIEYASFSIMKEFQYGNNDETYYDETSGDDNCLAEVEAATGLDLNPVYRGLRATDGVSIVNYPNILNYRAASNATYYNSYFSGVSDINENMFTQLGYTVIGRYPTADDEILITRYQYENYNALGFDGVYDGEPNIQPEDVTADNNATTGIIGKHINLSFRALSNNDVINDIDFEIVGILDTKLDPKFDSLKEETTDRTILDELVVREFNAAVDYGMHNVMYVNKGLVAKVIADNLASIQGVIYDGDFLINRGEYYDMLMATSFVKLDEVVKSDIVWIGEEKTTLASNEVLINSSTLSSIMQTLYSESNGALPNRTFRVVDYENRSFTNESSATMQRGEYLNALMDDPIIRYIEANGVPDSFEEKYREENSIPEDMDVGDLSLMYYNVVSRWRESFVNDTYADEHKLGALLSTRVILDFINETGAYNFDNDFAFQKDYGDQEVCVPVGVILTESYSNKVYVVSDDYYASKSIIPKGYYASFIGIMPESSSAIMDLIRYSYDGTNPSGYRYSLQNQVMASLSSVNDLIENIVPIFLYVGLGLAAFAALLLANFIAVSISNKKQEIGILRAVGAKSSDVFAIFFFESFIIAMINFVLALTATIVGINILNSVFLSTMGISITILVFGIRQIAVLLAVSVGVAFLASFLPVMAIARKQPIDSIRDK